MTRRRRPCPARHACLLALAFALVSGPVQGVAADEGPVASKARSPTVDAAVTGGLAWLAAAQQPDGSWGSGPFRGSVAVTAQVMLAIASAGDTPASGRHADALTRGVEYLLACAAPDGLIAGNEQAAHGPMYGHAFATTVLAELYGETDVDDRVAEVLVAARGLIDRTQNNEGGWRYQPIRADADLSVTVGVLVALRALHASGYEVDATTVERAAAFIAGLQNPDGGFRYRATPGPGGSPRTAAALFGLLVAGRADEPLLAAGRAWLDAHPLSLDAADGYALYGLCYEAAARWQRHAGDPGWNAWHQEVAGRLLAAQRGDGAWQDPSGDEYGTAAAVMVLCMPRGLAPLFQPESFRPDSFEPGALEPASGSPGPRPEPRP